MVQAVGAVGEMEGGEDGVVDVLGRPAADMTAAMQEDFEEADDARVVDLDAGIAHRADGDRKSKALQQPVAPCLRRGRLLSLRRS